MVLPFNYNVNLVSSVVGMVLQAYFVSSVCGMILRADCGISLESSLSLTMKLMDVYIVASVNILSVVASIGFDQLPQNCNSDT